MNQQVTTIPLKSDSGTRMGGIFLEQGKLRSEDIERVLRDQKKLGTSFGETARNLGLVTDKDVQQALARQFDYYYVQPGEAQFAPELVAAYDPFSPQVEMIRSVRTHLMQNWFGIGHSALTMVSAAGGEGTSVFTANLAVVFAQLGERTLLIDANLRNPRQHVIFNLGTRLGLSDILVHRAGVETFSKIEAFPNLSVLPAGTIAPNPLELVSRPAFAEIVNGLSGRYDVILIDAPAFTNGADALAVSSRTRGAMLVCRKNHARADFLRAVSQRLTHSGVKLVGSVLVEF